jgi:hypothetical protein
MTQIQSHNGNELSKLNDEMSALILPWAKQNHPEKYKQTVEMAKWPGMLIRYLIRLIEIRWETDLPFRSSVPCHVLEETSIVARFRDRKMGNIIEVKGKNATGGRVWGFKELILDRESFDELAALKRDFDLELVAE